MRPISMRKFGAVLLTVAVAATAVGCERERPTRYPNGQPNPGQWQGGYNQQPQGQWGQPQGQWGQPQGQWGQPQGQWGQPQPGQPQPGQPQPGQPQPGQPVVNDPVNNVDIGALRGRAGSVLTELKGALKDSDRNKVQAIPLFADPSPGEVNAFAACDDQGQALMAVSDGLLEVMAFSARSKATDELFQTRKFDQYMSLLAKNMEAKKPLPRPAAGFYDPGQDNDPRKVARQNELMDEQLAFVLGHELAHHYLGHTGCANGGGSRGVNAQDFGRLLTRVMPGLNQQAEMASDVSGVNNLLAAGARRQGVKWNEEGAMLSLNFFAAMDRLTPESIIFAFESTHPPPQLRMPIVQSTANTFRMTGGNALPIPFTF